jgi:MFS transporter, UMF1 family
VKEPQRAVADRVPPRAALRGLWASVRGLGQRRSLRNYLLSSMFYRDALNGLFSFGGVYAYGVLGWSTPQIGLFGILGAVTATLASWWGGRLDARFGPKPVITGSVLVLIGVCLVVVGMNRESLFGLPLAAGSTLPDLIFYLCGALIGGAGGTVQAASRTLVVRHTSPERAAETFGLFAFTGKATAFLAPGLITLATTLSGDQQIGITPLIGLFLMGIVLLAWVNPKGEPRP